MSSSNKGIVDRARRNGVHHTPEVIAARRVTLRDTMLLLLAAAQDLPSPPVVLTLPI